MNKKLLMLATAAAFSTSAALADIKVYGTAHVDMRVNAPDSYGSVNSNNSTLGFKISTDLAGLKAYFKHHFTVSGVDSDIFLAKTDTSYLSLQGDFGALRLGNQDTPATLALRFVGNNPLRYSIADFNRIGFTEYDRTKVLLYESNIYSGFKAAIGAISIENTTRDLLDSHSIGLMYDEGHGMKLGFGYETIDDQGIGDIARALGVGTQKNDSSLLQFGGSYTFDNIMLGAQFEKTKNLLIDDPNSRGYGLIPQDGVDRTAFGVTGKVTFGNNALSINLGQEKIETDQAAKKVNFASVALHHTINKQVSTYIAFSNKNAGTPDFKTAAQNNNLDSAVTSLIKQRALAIGMIYDF